MKIPVFDSLRIWVARLGALFTRRKLDRDFRQELDSHLALLTEENLRRGMTPDEACRAARVRLGGLTQLRETHRELHGLPWIERLAQDLRYALRTLRKSPGFTAIAVLTLALGIGANTAIFSVVDGVLLAPLPYAQPDRLVAIWESNPRFPHVWISYPNFRDWQRSARSFEQMVAFNLRGYDLTGPGTPAHLDGKAISAGFFGALGVRLALGSDFTSQEDQPGGPPVVIVSDRLWKDRFGGSPAALGKILTLDGADYTIAGVLAPGFVFESDADVYTPLAQLDPVLLSDRGDHDSTLALARLKPGATIAQARAEMSAIQKHLDQLYPDADRDLGTDVVPLKQQIIGEARDGFETRGTLLLLLGAVGLVLLIACANVASLLLARSASRAREFATRLALGASRIRLVQQLITESVLLAFTGGSIGLALAAWGLKPMLAFVPGGLPRSEGIAVNGGVLLFMIGVSMSVGVLFGLAPALRFSKPGLDAALKEGARGSTGAHHRAQSSLVIVQVSLTLVLLAGASLLLRTIHKLWQVNPGFDSQNVVSFQVGVSHSLTKDASSTRTAYRQLIERIRSVPGVRAADYTWAVPLAGQGGTMPFWIGSNKPLSLQGAPRLLMFLTGSDYLPAMGIPLVRGRFFNLQDTTRSPCVVAIDSVFARLYFPGSDPVGESLSFGFNPVGPCRIVGVVGHVRNAGLGEANTDAQPQTYFPLDQDPDRWVPINFPNLTVVVRTTSSLAAIMPEIRKTVFGAGGEQPIYNVKSIREIASDSMASQRFPMVLIGAFAALALLLASVGIYGVLSYSVSQRTHEIGIRMALGAEKHDVLRMTIGQGLRLAAAGLGIGVSAGVILTRFLTSFSGLLFGVTPNDPLTFAAVGLLLIGVTVVASYIPARRATQVDPMVALRHE
jgi:predicted permease